MGLELCLPVPFVRLGNLKHFIFIGITVSPVINWGKIYKRQHKPPKTNRKKTIPASISSTELFPAVCIWPGKLLIAKTARTSTSFNSISQPLLISNETELAPSLFSRGSILALGLESRWQWNHVAVHGERSNLWSCSCLAGAPWP